MGTLGGWSKRQKLTIDHTQVDDELTDFPVKVIVSSDNPLFDTAKSDGSDVRFTAADGETLLKFEREVHDTTEKIAVYHVKIPSVSSTSDTDFYLYYGNASASDASSPASVWDSDYVLVMHMDGSLKDSTSNGNDGTNYGSTLGLASDGYYRSFDGVNDYIRYPLLGIFDGSYGFSIELKYNHNNDDGDQHLLNTMGEHSVQIQTGEFQPSNVLHCRPNLNGVWKDVVIAPSHSLNTEYYTALTYNPTSGWLLYVDDQSVDSNSETGSINTMTRYNAIGRRSSHEDSHFDGTISEVRISSTTRSDAWIKATSASLHNNLLTFGSEEPAVTMMLAFNF